MSWANPAAGAKAKPTTIAYFAAILARRAVLAQVLKPCAAKIIAQHVRGSGKHIIDRPRLQLPPSDGTANGPHKQAAPAPPGKSVPND